jgi:hypothetical protein
MTTWHVWGDFVHTLPQTIGDAMLIDGEDRAARQSADESGFDFERRMRNGFEPWAATFRSENDAGQEFAYASCPIVRGWKKL